MNLHNVALVDAEDLFLKCIIPRIKFSLVHLSAREAFLSGQ